MNCSKKNDDGRALLRLPSGGRGWVISRRGQRKMFGGLISRPDLAGRVVVKCIVSGKGVVMRSAVSQTSLGDPKVERCIADAVRRWTFPRPNDGGVVVVNYPFQLNSQ